ncbi:MAG: hypothetical protein K1X88_14220 [Nannocystaceae bacterium]|nr:hypothetical protein [Nannocystaceae bacterium]
MTARPTADREVPRDTHEDPDVLLELAGALKHDLGKYVAWRSANLGEAEWSGPLQPALIEALCADLLRTRDAPEGAESAAMVFARLSAQWPRPWPDELAAVAAAVATLQQLEPALHARDGAAIARARPEIRAAQATIRSQLAALVRRLASGR